MHSSKKVASLKFSVKKVSVMEEDSKIYEEKLHQNPDGHCNYNYFILTGPKIQFVGVSVCLVGFCFCFGVFVFLCFSFVLFFLFSTVLFSTWLQEGFIKRMDIIAQPLSLYAKWSPLCVFSLKVT